MFEIGWEFIKTAEERVGKRIVGYFVFLAMVFGVIYAFPIALYKIDETKEYFSGSAVTWATLMDALSAMGFAMLVMAMPVVFIVGVVTLVGRLSITKEVQQLRKDLNALADDVSYIKKFLGIDDSDDGEDGDDGDNVGEPQKTTDATYYYLSVRTRHGRIHRNRHENGQPPGLRL